MTYIIVGTLGLVIILIAVVLPSDQTTSAYVIGVAGALLTAIGLIGFGWQRWRDRQSPSRMLQDVEAKEELARREEERQQQEAKEQAEREADELRQAQLRDIERIRKAILTELQEKLGESASLIFEWGHTQGDNELREYRIMQGTFKVAFQHQNRRSGWSWPEGDIPSPPDDSGNRDWDSMKPTDVQRAYKLLQPERYLVAIHSPNDPLELPEPGYTRWGK